MISTNPEECHICNGKDPQLAKQDGFVEGLIFVGYHIRQLKKEWDHIEPAVQVLEALENRIAEDTK